MIVYERNIKLKLLLVRILFLVLAVSILKAFDLGWENFTYFSVVIFLVSALINISDFTIYHDRIEVLRWYFFGLIPVKWAMGNSVEGHLKTYRMYDEITFETHLGGCISFLFIFFPVKYKFQGIHIRCRNSFGVLSKINLKLNDEEFRLVKLEMENVGVKNESIEPQLFEQKE